VRFLADDCTALAREILRRVAGRLISEPLAG